MTFWGRLLAISLLLPGYSIAQSVEINQQVHSPSLAYSVFTQQDSSFIVFAKSFELIGINNIKEVGWVAIQLDDSGNLVNESIYPDYFPKSPGCVAKNNTNGYAGFGISKKDSIKKDDFAFILFDNSLDTLLTRQYGDTNIQEGIHGVALAQGGYAAIGNDFSQNSGDVWLLRLNENGDLLWENHYGGSNTELASKILQLSDGGFIISGNKEIDNQSPIDSIGYFIIRTDSTGNEIWSEELGYAGSGIQHSSGIIESSNGSIILWGREKTGTIGTNDLYKVYMANLNSDGTIKWQKSVGEESTSLIVNGVFELPDNSLFVQGAFFDSTDNKTKAMILKVAESGDMLWKRLYLAKAPDSNAFYNAQAFYDIQPYSSGFVLTGHLSAASWHPLLLQSWLLTVDTNGFILSSEQLLSNSFSLKKSLLIYPNPTSGILFFASEVLNDHSVLITDLTGRLITSFKNNIPQKKIDLTSEPDGMYFITLVDPTGLLIESVKLVKRSQ